MTYANQVFQIRDLSNIIGKYKLQLEMSECIESKKHIHEELIEGFKILKKLREEYNSMDIHIPLLFISRDRSILIRRLCNTEVRYYSTLEDKIYHFIRYKIIPLLPN